MSRKFNYLPKTFRQRTLKEKLFFWKQFSHFVETDDPNAEYEEVIVYGKEPFNVRFFEGLDKHYEP